MNNQFKYERVVLNFGDINPLEFMSGVLIRTKNNKIKVYLSMGETEENRYVIYDTLVYLSMGETEENRYVIYDTFISFIKYDLEKKELIGSLDDLLNEFSWIDPKKLKEVESFIGLEINKDNFNTINDLMSLYTSLVQYYGVENFSLDKELYSLSQAKKLLRMY